MDTLLTTPLGAGYHDGPLVTRALTSLALLVALPWPCPGLALLSQKKWSLKGTNEGFNSRYRSRSLILKFGSQQLVLVQTYSWVYVSRSGLLVCLRVLLTTLSTQYALFFAVPSSVLKILVVDGKSQ